MPRSRVKEALETIMQKCPESPRIAVVLGSGLGLFAESLDERIVIPYKEIPGWPMSTAPGHAGRLVWGRLDGIPLAVMQGRLHYYEGHSTEDVVFPVRVFGEWGTELYIPTNASGGVSHNLRAGDLVVITDHINLMGLNPLRGENDERWGPRFPDMTKCYDGELADIAIKAAMGEGIPLHRGVYIAFPGPSFETPAEIRMARMMGADVVGMSTVLEVITARHMGMRVCAISCVANAAAGMTGEMLTHEEVLAAMEEASGRLVSLLRRIVAVAGSLDA